LIEITANMTVNTATVNTGCPQHKFWYTRTGVSVVAVAPYYIDTPFLGQWADWTPDTAAQEELQKSAKDKKMLRYEYTYCTCRVQLTVFVCPVFLHVA
jgi:hypothetical protein